MFIFVKKCFKYIIKRTIIYSPTSHRMRMVNIPVHFLSEILCANLLC